jgi:predicted TIM-barrel fold metal-dependent hydrolase
MRIVALEEHFTVPDLASRIPSRTIAERGWPPGDRAPASVVPIELPDLGAGRIQAMDAAGITVEVLSMAGPGADLLDGKDGIAFARDANDRLARAVSEHPTRLAGFAHLPLRAPEAAAEELERAVRDLGFKGALLNGSTRDRFVDDPAFEPLLARAEALDVPLYLHPGIPPEAVRKAYYEGLPRPVQFLLGAPAWGWHVDTAVHVLRLVLSGTFDRHPRLRVIIGHMGETLPIMMARLDDVLRREVTHLERTVSQTILDHVVITTSGFFSTAPFVAALMTFGVDRILFSVDYPYSRNDLGRAFLDRLPVPADDLSKIAHRNADRVLKLSAA